MFMQSMWFDNIIITYIKSDVMLLQFFVRFLHNFCFFFACKIGNKWAEEKHTHKKKTKPISVFIIIFFFFAFSFLYKHVTTQVSIRIKWATIPNKYWLHGSSHMFNNLKKYILCYPTCLSDDENKNSWFNVSILIEFM